MHGLHGHISLTFRSIFAVPLISNTVSWCANNTEGQHKRAIVVGIVVGFGNINGAGEPNRPQLARTGGHSLTD